MSILASHGSRPISKQLLRKHESVGLLRWSWKALSAEIFNAFSVMLSSFKTSAIDTTSVNSSCEGSKKITFGGLRKLFISLWI